MRDPQQLDMNLNLFLNQCFQDGMSLNEATKFLAAVIDAHPEVSAKGCLPRARRALKGWKNLDPGNSRPPIAWPIIALVVSKMIEMGHNTVALFVLTMFATYCRPFELLLLQKKDLIRSKALSMPWSLVLNKSEDLEQSKVGMQDECMVLNNQEMPWLGDALAAWASKNLSQSLFTMNYHTLRDVWKLALQKANLPEAYMVPYQMRHSGASWDIAKNYRTALEVKLRGRWATESSMKRYEKHAMVMQNFCNLSQPLQQAALAATKHLRNQVLNACGLRQSQ